MTIEQDFEMLFAVVMPIEPGTAPYEPEFALRRVRAEIERLRDEIADLTGDGFPELAGEVTPIQTDPEAAAPNGRKSEMNDEETLWRARKRAAELNEELGQVKAARESQEWHIRSLLGQVGAIRDLLQDGMTDRALEAANQTLAEFETA
jgi:hypothetical protein